MKTEDQLMQVGLSILHCLENDKTKEDHVSRAISMELLRFIVWTCEQGSNDLYDLMESKGGEITNDFIEQIKVLRKSIAERN